MPCDSGDGGGGVVPVRLWLLVPGPKHNFVQGRHCLLLSVHGDHADFLTPPLSDEKAITIVVPE